MLWTQTDNVRGRHANKMKVASILPACTDQFVCRVYWLSGLLLVVRVDDQGEVFMDLQRIDQESPHLRGCVFQGNSSKGFLLLDKDGAL